jgi:hypothetical protein
MGTDVQIPDGLFWGGVAFVGTVVGWLVRLEARLNARLTRKEHAEICDRSNGLLAVTLAKIQMTLEKQDDTALFHRQLVGDSLASIRTQVAVIRTRMGDNALDDTGAHPQLSDGRR